MRFGVFGIGEVAQVGGLEDGGDDDRPRGGGPMA
jgi:hypothetical protein